MEGKISNEEIVNKITDVIMNEYEKPKHGNLEKRQESAQAWYKILKEEQ